MANIEKDCWHAYYTKYLQMWENKEKCYVFDLILDAVKSDVPELIEKTGDKAKAYEHLFEYLDELFGDCGVRPPFEELKSPKEGHSQGV